MSSTTEHLDYADLTTKSRRQLMAELRTSRRRIEKLVGLLDEARREGRSRSKALTKARKRIKDLQRELTTASAADRTSANKVVDVITSAIKQALNT